MKEEEAALAAIEQARACLSQALEAGELTEAQTRVMTARKAYEEAKAALVRAWTAAHQAEEAWKVALEAYEEGK